MATQTTHISRLMSPTFPVGNMGDWQGRHLASIRSPRDGHERFVVELVSSWLGYADAHQQRFESCIGEDYVLGPEWESIGRALLGLLNGETGRLDCGTLDGCIRDALAAEGFSAE